MIKIGCYLEELFNGMSVSDGRLQDLFNGKLRTGCYPE